MRRTALLASILALAGCYSSGSVPPVILDDAGVEPPPPPSDDEDLACEPSELSLAWVRQDGGTTYRPEAVQLAPGGALFVVRTEQGGVAARMRDGEPIATLLQSAPLDAAWAREVAVDPETREVSVREIATGDSLRSIETIESLPGWSGDTSATLSPDGERAIVLDCDREIATDRSRTIVREIDVSTGAVRSVEMPFACAASSAARTLVLAPSSRGAALVMGLREPGPEWTEEGAVRARWIARVDFESAMVSARVELGAERAEVSGTATVGEPPLGIVGQGLSDDGEVLAVVGRDGRLRRFDTRTLAEIGAPIGAAIFVANPDSFLPSLESPVGLSETSTWLAHVDDEPAIVIRDAVSGVVATRLELPFVALGEGRGESTTMALRFVRDGLLVVSSTGVARFTCGGRIESPVPPDGELTVRVEGPASVRSGELVRFSVDVDRAVGPVIRAVRLGEGQLLGSVGRVVSAYAYAETSGAVAVEAIADDGVRTARATTSLDVWMD